MFKAASNKSNAKRALKSIGDKAFAAADQLIVEVDGKWGFDVEAAQAIQNPVEEVATPVKPCGMGAMVAQLTGEAVDATPAATNKAKKSSGVKIEKERVEQNGVSRQSKGSVGDQLWAIYDKKGSELTHKDAMALAKEAGFNLTSASIAFYNWRKFNSFGK